MKTKTFNILFGCILERCVFLTGDGEGSSEKKLGTTETPELCFEKVAKQEPKANGVTYGLHGQGRDKECYAEFKMKHINKNANKWQSCLFGGNSYLRNIPQFQNRTLIEIGPIKKHFSCLRCFPSKVSNALDKDTASQGTMLAGMAKVLKVKILVTTFVLKSPNVLTQHGMGAKHAPVTMK